METLALLQPFAALGHLAAAWLAGSLIGLERTFHGRPAGFRTHALVCTASALLMLLTAFQGDWLIGAPLEAVRADPTRMAQGIMTGIGFLGAGVIFKDGLTVRGLTTAASIWMTASIGILFGVGFWLPAIAATLTTLGTLSIFRWIERHIPSEVYAHYLVRFRRHEAPPESELRELIGSHHCEIADLSYAIAGEGRLFQYRMVLRTTDRANLEQLAETLKGMESILEFDLSATGN